MSSDEDKTMGEVCNELQAVGWMNYVARDGRVWRLKYMGEILLADWQMPPFELEGNQP